jgi:hypothetical protein
MKLLMAIWLVIFHLLYTSANCQCGTERWKVKTLTDDEAESINFTPVSSTVHKQLHFIKPDYHEENLRDESEKQVYRIKCKVIKYKAENDQDWHIVIQDLVTKEQMVVEIPSPVCIDSSNPHFSKIPLVRKRFVALVGPVKKQFRAAPKGLKMEVSGVGFFDKSNHPVGSSGRELHPVIDLKAL